jgi:BirA family biotin operon repressor/biotin-[acetyl-CoA-carboxylase] ligase
MDFSAPEWLDRTPSTNSLLRERMAASAQPPEGAVLATLEQTAGRGRFERRWESGAGKNLTFSFCVQPHGRDEDRATLAMAVALGVSDYLASEGLTTRTKWPNDVLVGDRKICGILAELCQSGTGRVAMVVGVGLNVNMTEEDLALIDRPATSMSVLTGRRFDVRTLLPVLLTHLSARIDTWLGKGFAGLRADWEQQCAYIGQQVLIEDDRNMWQGILSGFGESGELILERPDGETKTVWSGDVVRARPVE